MAIGSGAQVYVSIGSNVEREKNTRAAIDELQKRFGLLELSSVYEAEAIGYEGDNYYNLVAGFKTTLSVGELSKSIKAIEDDYGRNREKSYVHGQVLDIDILTYDNLVGLVDGVQLPRDEITKNAYVLLPLCEVAGEDVHPALHQTYNELWLGYEQGKQQLWKVELKL